MSFMNYTRSQIYKKILNQVQQTRSQIKSYTISFPFREVLLLEKKLQKFNEFDEKWVCLTQKITKK